MTPSRWRASSRLDRGSRPHRGVLGARARGLGPARGLSSPRRRLLRRSRHVRACGRLALPPGTRADRLYRQAAPCRPRISGGRSAAAARSASCSALASNAIRASSPGSPSAFASSAIRPKSSSARRAPTLSSPRSTGSAFPIRRRASRRPPTPDGWLMKRIGGSGGLHILNCPAKPRPDPRRYFQRRVDGEAISVMGIVSKRGNAFAMSRQWTSPLPKRPYRYGGAAGSLTLEADLEARLIDTSLALARELDLVGLVSFDFLVADGEADASRGQPPPRRHPSTSSTMPRGACSRPMSRPAPAATPPPLLHTGWRPPAARAAAFLYADRGPLAAPDIEWPSWAADRPRPGIAHFPASAGRDRPRRRHGLACGRVHLSQSLGASRGLAV